MNKMDELLKEHNLRITTQRKAIFQILSDHKGNHLETENIYKLLQTKKDKDKRTGLATVYRTMELFEKIGLVSKLEMGNSPARYELMGQDRKGHHHLICLKCGMVQEIEDKHIHELKNKILKVKDFQVINKPIKIYGYCSNCRKHTDAIKK